MAQWKKLLKSLGFTDSESAVYLSSLEIGPVAVQDLAKKAGVSRVTTYAVIESLTERGLMSSVEKGKKRLFVAESPERLMSYVQNRVKEMEATLKDAEGSMDELKLIQRGEKPVVKMFEGKDALKAILSDMVSARPVQIDEWGNLDEIFKMYKREELQSWYRELERVQPQNHRTRGLYLAKNQEVKAGRSTDDIMRLPTETLDFGGDILVYGTKVALSTFRGKQISVLIESEEIAKTLRQLFDYVWSFKK